MAPSNEIKTYISHHKCFADFFIIVNFMVSVGISHKQDRTFHTSLVSMFIYCGYNSTIVKLVALQLQHCNDPEFFLQLVTYSPHLKTIFHIKFLHPIAVFMSCDNFFV